MATEIPKDKFGDMWDVAEKSEILLLKKLNDIELELLTNIIMKMMKKENEACIALVKSHERFYTKNLENIIEDLQERYPD
jgi:hypothetical protein